MADDKKKKDSDEFDIFIMNSIYPDAALVFAQGLQPLSEIKDSSKIVIDTNALLVPYNIGKDSLAQIENTYRPLVEQKRIVIPGQVAREFAKNRAYKLTEIYQQFFSKLSRAEALQKSKYPLLDSLAEYQRIIELEEKINQSIVEYRKTVQEVLEHIRGWHWDDPVSTLYSDLFVKDVIYDLTLDHDAIRADLNKRKLYSIPPGYKDSGKEDAGVGDLLIWLTILEIGRQYKTNIIFVSGEEKADWYYRSEKKALYPRYELIDEYRRESENHSFHMISFSQFLDLYGASEKVVEEVKREEEKREESEEIRQAVSQAANEETSNQTSLAEYFLAEFADFRRIVTKTYLQVFKGAGIAPLRVMLQALSQKEIMGSDFLDRANYVADFRNELLGKRGKVSEKLFEKVSDEQDGVA